MTEYLPDWLEQRAWSHADHPALLFEETTIPFGELAARAATTSARLRTLGVAPGDRVALLLGNRPEFLDLMFACMRLGAVVVPLNCRLTSAEIARQVDDCHASLLAYEGTARERVAGARLPSLRRVCVDTEALDGDQILAEIAADQLVAGGRIGLQAVHSVVYTSGSSGQPKGVLLTYGNHFWSAVGSALNLGVRGDDRWLACLPFCHVGGLSILLRSAIYGTTAVVHRRFDPEQANRAIDEERVTIISVVANMLQRMLKVRGSRPYPPWLRCVLLGGGPAPLSLLQECAARRVPVIQTYGLTEAASQVTTLPPREAERKLSSAGRPLLMTEVRVCATNGDATTGEVGEIVVRGPTVSPGYVDGTSAVSEDGWLRTGDFGRVDTEGFLYVVGRRDDLIISGGENIYPAEVEAALHAHPAVAEACVFGLPDPEWGEIIAARIRLCPGATTGTDELTAHVRRLLAGSKVPRQFGFVDDFPRTASGKIGRAQVRVAALRVQGGATAATPRQPSP
jgi:O-succinylbenzoic acid--CoA ligase